MDPTGVLRGVDASHHQEDIDVGRLPVDFVIARTAQAAGGKYGTTRDRAYAKHKANAQRAGKLFCSYLYLGNAVSPAANAALHASIEPDRSVPMMVDWEDGSGDGAFLRAVVAELGKLDYQVRLTYAPRWYWQKVGSPSLAGLPPLVSSRYPDRNPGDFDTQYRKIPANFWDGYGGNTVAVVQISANGRLQPYPGTDLDLNAYRGTRDQFAALLNQEDDMFTPDDFKNLMWGNVFDTNGNRNFAAFVKDMDAKLSALAAKAAGATAEEIAAKLLPALTTALLAEVAKVDAISDADAEQIAEAVTARAGVLLGGGQ
jgi:lysozyme